MPNYIAVGSAGAGTVAHGAEATPRTNLRQELITSGDVFQWIKEGRVFQAGSGSLTTPETVTATALTRQQPQIYVRVPSSLVVIPMFACITFEATGAAVNEALISTYNNDIGTSNATAATPVNVNTRYATKASGVTCYATVTGNTGTAGTQVVDLWRSYMQADQDAITGAPTPPLIYNPFAGIGQLAIVGNGSAINTWAVHLANGTSSTAFVVITWAEFTYAEFYGS